LKFSLCFWADIFSVVVAAIFSFLVAFQFPFLLLSFHFLTSPFKNNDAPLIFSLWFWVDISLKVAAFFSCLVAFQFPFLFLSFHYSPTIFTDGAHL
jgi:hypothetical protein